MTKNILAFLKKGGNNHSPGRGEMHDYDAFDKLIKALPYVTCILDKERKVEISRPIELDNGQTIEVEELFGHQTGEALNCLHAIKSREFCDGDGICRYCGLPNAIIQSEITGKKSQQETTVTVVGNDRTMTYDIRVTAIPLTIGNRRLTLLAVMDISEAKRKKVLERIFFHDILNKTGSLQGILNILNDSKDPGEKKELLELSEDILADLNEEIILQKQLMAAETGELVVNRQAVDGEELLNSSVKQVNKLTEREKIKVGSEPGGNKIQLTTDPVLVKRILINMLTNALEASSSDQKVTAGINKENHHVRFWVYNQTVIPEHVRMQLFNRNFSTKGENRGLGTYSMKLLGENYLGGKVHFESNPEGTTFYFDLPL